MKNVSFFCKKFSLLSVLFLFAFNSVSFAEDVPDISSSETSIVFDDSSSGQQEKLTDTNPESEISINSSDDSGYSGFGAFIKMIVVLAIFVAAIYLLFKFIKKQNNPGNEDNPFMRKVFHLTLSPGKSVHVVTLVDSAYLLGVSDSNVNLIEKIEDKELVNAINVYADKNSPEEKPKTFAELLEIFMPNKNRRKREDADNAAKEILDGIRSRVKNLEEE